MDVGVIVPVHGEAPWLEEALESVLGQDPAPSDVVVVDDGSPRPVQPSSSVRVVRRDVRGGPAAARQTGLEALSTDLVALCDADDAWQPGKLAAQLAALERYPEATICFGSALVVGADGQPTGERFDELPGGVHSAASLAPLLYDRDLIPAASTVIRRYALVAAGGFAPAPAPIASDWDLWLRLVARGQSFVCEPSAVIRYRRHAGAVTADIEALADASLRIHYEHAGLVSSDATRRARAHDYAALARGRIRQRRYEDAGDAFRKSAQLAPPPLRDRATALALATPGVRALLGRRDPYRG